MKEKQFSELLESVKQTGEIIRGKRKPSRVFDPGARIKSIRDDMGKTRAQVRAVAPHSTLHHS